MLNANVGRLAGLLAAVTCLQASQMAQACGPTTDCVLDDRTYRIRLPAGDAGHLHDQSSKIGAVVFLHGYEGAPSGIMRNKDLRVSLSKIGFALVAPKSAGKGWLSPDYTVGTKPKELQFLDRLLDVLEERHAIDPKRLIAAGFSAGGMMVWNLACYRAARFKAFVPIAGTFWKPMPETCPGPFPTLSHVHGTADRIVPLKGRKLSAAFQQGNVHAAISRYASWGNYSDRPRIYRDRQLACRRFDANDDSAPRFVELCLHKRGHTYAGRFITRVARQVFNLGPPQRRKASTRR